jgi:hypothetical protein
VLPRERASKKESGVNQRAQTGELVEEKRKSVSVSGLANSKKNQREID